MNARARVASLAMAVAVDFALMMIMIIMLILAIMMLYAGHCHILFSISFRSRLIQVHLKLQWVDDVVVVIEFT